MSLNLRIVFTALAALMALAGQVNAVDLLYVNEGASIFTYDVTKATASEVLSSKTIFSNAGFSQGGAMAFDSSGNLFAGDMNFGTSLIKKFNSSGVLQQSINSSSVVSGVAGLAFNSSGNLFVSSGFTYTNPAIFDNSGSYLGRININTTNQFAIDNSNNFFIAGTDRVYKYNSSGTLISNFSIPSSINNGLTLDHAGNIYVADYLGKKVVKLDSTGAISGVYGSSLFQGSPIRIAVDKNGNIFTSGSGNYITKFNSAGVFQYQWSAPAGGIAFAPTTVPEPSTYALGLIASGALAAIAKRRKSRKITIA